MLPGANSPEPNVEKEDNELEVEEKQKKDPTLPGPKSAKMKIKNPKLKGMSDGQDKILKKKGTKRCLYSESTVCTVPMMEKEGRPGNPGLDQPGPKKRFQVPQSKTSAIVLSEEKEARMVPKGLSPPARHRAFPLEGKERAEPHEPLIQEPGSVFLEDEASTELDLEQIMEDIGRKSEEREAL